MVQNGTGNILGVSRVVKGQLRRRRNRTIRVQVDVFRRLEGRLGDIENILAGGVAGGPDLPGLPAAAGHHRHGLHGHIAVRTYNKSPVVAQNALGGGGIQYDGRAIAGGRKRRHCIFHNMKSKRHFLAAFQVLREPVSVSLGPLDGVPCVIMQERAVFAPTGIGTERHVTAPRTITGGIGSRIEYQEIIIHGVVERQRHFHGKARNILRDLSAKWGKVHIALADDVQALAGSLQGLGRAVGIIADFLQRGCFGKIHVVQHRTVDIFCFCTVREIQAGRSRQRSPRRQFCCKCTQRQTADHEKQCQKKSQNFFHVSSFLPQ